MTCNNATMNDATMNNATVNNAYIQGNSLELKPTNNYYADFKVYKPGDDNTYGVINWYGVFFQKGYGEASIINDGNNQLIRVDNYSNQSYMSPTEVVTPKLTQTSLESIKKNISIYNDNALQTILNSDIYTYNLKSEKDVDKKHIGFVIGDKYRTPKEVMNNEQNGIELYSAIGILWKGIQEHIKEQNEEIEKLKQEIEKLKKGEK